MIIDEAIARFFTEAGKDSTDAGRSQDLTQVAYWLVELKDARHCVQYLRLLTKTYRRCIYWLVATNFIVLAALGVKILKLRGVI